jgi:sodium-dependent dicarboxylate transporter 2/3/5
MNVTLKQFGFWGGCSAFAGLMLFGDGSTFMAVMAIAAWMLIWWITEAVPIAVTALLPLVLFPLTGTESIDKVAGAYGSQYVFLFMGGFILALAMEKWMLHKRIALAIVSAVGTSRRRIVLRR